jgi:hypothetical protein
MSYVPEPESARSSSMSARSMFAEQEQQVATQDLLEPRVLLPLESSPFTSGQPLTIHRAVADLVMHAEPHLGQEGQLVRLCCRRYDVRSHIKRSWFCSTRAFRFCCRASNLLQASM